MAATSELAAAQANLRAQLEMHINFRRTMVGESFPYPYLCNEDLVLKHGRSFFRASRSPVSAIPKACFHQAYRLATRKGSKWIYCEGYAVSPSFCGMAVPHAWVTSPVYPELAYELAWPFGNANNTAYYGIAFDAAYVRKMHLASERLYYSVLDTWWADPDYPLITGETKVEDVMWKGTKEC